MSLSFALLFLTSTILLGKNLKISVLPILPTPILGFDKQRLIIIRPKDNIQRPCVLVTHGLGTCTNTEDSC